MKVYRIVPHAGLWHVLSGEPERVIMRSALFWAPLADRDGDRLHSPLPLRPKPRTCAIP